METKLNIIFDEKRCGYWVKGYGFDFFAYFTNDGGLNSWIECDCVTRKESDFTLHLSLPINTAKKPSCDLVETLMMQELSKYFDLKIKC